MGFTSAFKTKMEGFLKKTRNIFDFLNLKKLKHIYSTYNIYITYLYPFIVDYR